MDRLYGGNPFIKATMESACNIAKSDGTAKEAGRIVGNKESLLRNVFQRSKEIGAYIEIETYIGGIIGNGQ